MSAIALVTREEAKHFLKKTDDDAIDVLDAIIEGTSAIFNKVTERVLMTATYTAQAFESEGWPDLWLPNRPITALTSVTEDGTLLTSGTDFYGYLQEGRLRRMASVADGITGNWTSKPQAIVITYTAGFTAATLPADLKLAALIQIAAFWQKFMHKSFGETTRSVASQSITTTEEDLLPEVRTVLKLYKRWSF